MGCEISEEGARVGKALLTGHNAKQYVTQGGGIECRYLKVGTLRCTHRRPPKCLGFSHGQDLTIIMLLQWPAAAHTTIPTNPTTTTDFIIITAASDPPWRQFYTNRRKGHTPGSSWARPCKVNSGREHGHRCMPYKQPYGSICTSGARCRW